MWTDFAVASVPVPVGFETAGHVLHLNLRQEQLPHRHLIAQVLLDKTPRARTVVHKNGEVGGTFRTLPLELIGGAADYRVPLRHGAARLACATWRSTAAIFVAVATAARSCAPTSPGADVYLRRDGEESEGGEISKPRIYCGDCRRRVIR